MSDIAVRVDGLSKQYKIGGKQEAYKTLRDSITDALASPFQRAKSLIRGQAYGAAGLEETIWALKDVSFEVKRGEVVGIIGHNGAGKSTLLKILSRITEPTEGVVELYGRVGSLLEVGTGFHPELTGRENIYLNGAILGMTRAEIDRKFEEIVDFAGVERFIDTPVKHYSSGMGLRLGFAVAAHLEPEILVVDEVLAVGDVEFQRKCLGKMDDVAQAGRTVMFVSHNMSAVRELCGKAIVLNNGMLTFEDISDNAINFYLKSTRDNEATEAIEIIGNNPNRSGSGSGRILALGCLDENGIAIDTVGIAQPFTVLVTVRAGQQIESLVIGVEFKSWDGVTLCTVRSDGQNVNLGKYSPQDTITVEIKVPGLPFIPGMYYVEPWFADRFGKRIDHVHKAFTLSIEAIGNLTSEHMFQLGKGFFLIDCDWHATAEMNAFSHLENVDWI